MIEVGPNAKEVLETLLIVSGVLGVFWAIAYSNRKSPHD